MDRFNYIWTAFLLPARLLQHANRPHNFLIQPSLKHLSPPKDHLPPARFCSHFQLVSRLYIAVLPLWSSSSSLQAGCCRYNPLNATLPSTVRLLPTCSVGTSICLSRTTNLPPCGRLSITASTVSNWRGKVSQRNPMPFLLRTTLKESSYARRSILPDYTT